MPLPPLIALAVLILELCACSVDRSRQAAIDQMENRHAVSTETVGGGGM
jgi:hypothetical protein